MSAESLPTLAAADKVQSALPQELLDDIVLRVVPTEIHVKRFKIAGGGHRFEAMQEDGLRILHGLMSSKPLAKAALEALSKTRFKLHVWIAGEHKKGKANSIHNQILQYVDHVEFHQLVMFRITPTEADPEGWIMGPNRLREVYDGSYAEHFQRITGVFLRKGPTFSFDGVRVNTHSGMYLCSCQAPDSLKSMIVGGTIWWVQEMLSDHKPFSQGHPDSAGPQALWEGNQIGRLLEEYGDVKRKKVDLEIPGSGRIVEPPTEEMYAVLHQLSKLEDEKWERDHFVCEPRPWEDWP